MIEAFHTFDDGTLVDFAIDDQHRLTIRAGRSLTPSERPIVLSMTPRDMLMFVTILRELLPAPDRHGHNPAAALSLYDVARDVCHSFGLPWTDPRTGDTYDPPKGTR
jgi:hypothetical protein